jgi:ABC-type Mn2+/Zn2+ transport system permease subunit
MVVSYHLDISSGAAVVLAAAVVFAVVFAATGTRGLRRVGPRRADAPV